MDDANNNSVSKFGAGRVIFNGTMDLGGANLVLSLGGAITVGESFSYGANDVVVTAISEPGLMISITCMRGH